jgi:hypothetical protein
MRAALPHEFTPSGLVARIVLGALAGDDVRLHGAIAAAIELHGTIGARRDVLLPALAAAGDHGQRCRDAVAAAIGRHMVISPA